MPRAWYLFVLATLEEWTDSNKAPEVIPHYIVGFAVCWIGKGIFEHCHVSNVSTSAFGRLKPTSETLSTRLLEDVALVT